MKDCAAQAEKAGPREAEVNKGSYNNHYSPKYDRCYVRVSSKIQNGEQVSGQGIRLVDAFERNTVAAFAETFPPSKSRISCFVDEGRSDGLTTVDCSAAKDFIFEHMRN